MPNVGKVIMALVGKLSVRLAIGKYACEVPDVAIEFATVVIVFHVVDYPCNDQIRIRAGRVVIAAE